MKKVVSMLISLFGVWSAGNAVATDTVTAAHPARARSR
jgi:hypothetical protein